MPDDPLEARVRELEHRLNEMPHFSVSEAKQRFGMEADLGQRIRELEIEKAQLRLDLEKAQFRIQKMAQAPKWLQPAGMIIGLLTLLFFMAIVGASLFGKVIPETGKFPVLIVLALGTALSASFLTGHASVTGQIPFFGDKYPLAVSAGGGFAILILILLIGWKIYL